MTHILAIDQGTTSSRAIIYDAALRPLASASAPLPQHYPRAGWVEHDPDQIWDGVLACCRQVMAGRQVAAIGITNQRETTVVWERATGKALAPAIVWQDRRTAPRCAQLRAAGQSALIAARTGLLPDPYFSATKLAWLLDHIPDGRARARRSEILFGTVDSWLIWRLTGGRVHATDATNASRTMLFDIHTGRWCPDLCALFDVPMNMLPIVHDCAADFGATDPALFGTAIPICGVAGDQQAAAMGQACFEPGMLKATFGTGCFALLNTGERAVASQHQLLTTLAWSFGGRRSYALEGSIFNAGTVVQWLRDELGILTDSAEAGVLAAGADAAQHVILVPAFTGLGAPWWQPECRGAIFGLTRNTGRAALAKAALESVGHQTRDLWLAMRADWPEAATPVLRVDGGMAASDWTMQFLADLLNAPVDRPQITETTALGAAWLAGWQSGLCPGPDGFAPAWARDRRFNPTRGADWANARHEAWVRAVQATLSMGFGT